MKEIVNFETLLYGTGTNETPTISDIEFWVDKIVQLPSLRPLNLELAVNLSIFYCNIEDFRVKLLEKSKKCPVLIQRLYMKGIFRFSEIMPLINDDCSFIECYYYRKEIEDFPNIILKKKKPFDLIETNLENDDDIDQLIKYGFLQSSIEYCLKYDDINAFRSFDIINKTSVKWNPFEWSKRPPSMDLLSIAGFFGSLSCFKHLIMNNYVINDKIQAIGTCSGSLDLFHLCTDGRNFSSKCVLNSVLFCRLNLLEFLIENGAGIDIKMNNNMTFLHYATIYNHLSIMEYLINNGAQINAKTEIKYNLNLGGVLFIMLVNMVFCVLLSF